MTVRDDEAPPRPGTVHPHLARERALKVLFQADVRGEDPRVVLDRVETTAGALELLDELEPEEDEVAADDELRAELQRRRRLPLDDYTRLLVRGVASHRPSIDRLLEDVAERWTVTRMPGVDRNLLRLAVYELVTQDTPPAVVIDEAVSLARGFAGDRARPFVNGVLETVRRRVAAGEVELEAVAAPAPDDEVASERPAAVDVEAGPPSAPPATPPPADTAAAAPPAAPPPSSPPGDPSSAADEQAWDAALDLLTAVEGEDAELGEPDLGDVDHDDADLDALDAPDTVGLAVEAEHAADQLDLFGDDEGEDDRADGADTPGA